MENKKELLEKLNKELDKGNPFQAIHALCVLCSLAAIPIGVLAGSQTVSLLGIAWITSSFFSFSAESEKRHKQAIRSQVDFLNSVAAIEGELKSAQSSHGVSMGPIGLN